MVRLDVVSFFLETIRICTSTLLLYIFSWGFYGLLFSSDPSFSSNVINGACQDDFDKGINIAMGYSDGVVPYETSNPAKEDSLDPLLHTTRSSGLFFLSIIHPFF
jgi:hypothetical protein